MIKETLIIVFFAIYQTRARHFLLETENNVEAGSDYEDAYTDDYKEAVNPTRHSSGEDGQKNTILLNLFFCLLKF